MTSVWKFINAHISFQYGKKSSFITYYGHRTSGQSTVFPYKDSTEKKKARMTGWVGRIKIWYLFWSILEYDDIFVLCRITDLSLFFKKSVRIKEN